MSDNMGDSTVQSGIQNMALAGKKFELKTPKGTRDYGPLDMAIREGVFNTITRVFKRHGAVTIDTPVFELKEVLTGKYGEDSKLIYDLQDQGGELCSLRYDLTVPFARFLAMNKEYKHMKRYHIAKVYRRDNPAMTKGRFREFYQCDFDIAGEYDSMVPDAEILCIARQVLTELDIGTFKIKLNHRLLLDGIFEVAGVHVDQFRPVSSAIDKLDKATWAEVKHELVDIKHIPNDVADKIGEYVKLHGEPRKLLQMLQQDIILMGNARANQGIHEIALLIDYCDALATTDHIELDLSLARGLDYYTGVIFEAVSLNTTVGSIAAGGRYDDLVGMFDKNNRKIPCVGFSVGIERIFSIVESKASNRKAILGAVSVYVCSIGDAFMVQKMKLSQLLWDAGISCEYNYKKKAKLSQQFDACDEKGAQWAILFGEDELKQGIYKVRCMADKTEVNVPEGDIVPFIQSKLLQSSIV